MKSIRPQIWNFVVATFASIFYIAIAIIVGILLFDMIETESPLRYMAFLPSLPAFSIGLFWGIYRFSKLLRSRIAIGDKEIILNSIFLENPKLFSRNKYKVNRKNFVSYHYDVPVLKIITDKHRFRISENEIYDEDLLLIAEKLKSFRKKDN